VGERGIAGLRLNSLAFISGADKGRLIPERLSKSRGKMYQPKMLQWPFL
jgi:hypothetical protein